ncbi:hypothetical protein [Halopiger thermotolerans]
MSVLAEFTLSSEEFHFGEVLSRNSPRHVKLKQVVPIQKGAAPYFWAEDDDVDLDTLAENTDGYTGGDIEGIVREASMLALDEAVTAIERDGVESPEELDEAADGIIIEAEHFEQAVRKVKPSVTEEMHEFYEELVDDLGGESSDEQAAPADFQ